MKKVLLILAAVFTLTVVVVLLAIKEISERPFILDVSSLPMTHTPVSNGLKSALQFSFDHKDGYYDIDARYLSEHAHQNTFGMYLNGEQVIVWLGKDKDDEWHHLREQHWHMPRHIRIRRGDNISLVTLSILGTPVIVDSIVFTPSRLALPAESTVKTAPDFSRVTVQPRESQEAFKNPLKGFRGSRMDHEYSTLIKTYFKWKDLEDHEGADISQIIETCNKRWKGFEERNIKAIPRVYLEWPGQESGFPSDMEEGDYTSDKFRSRVLSLIRKLAAVWDNDPRVAYVEMGLIGQWGEMEFPDTGSEIKDAISKEFNDLFKNKLVMIRWPNTYNDHLYNFGYYWDSFAHYDQDYCGNYILATSPKWKTAVMGGETAFDWGNGAIQPGDSPETALSMAIHRDYIIDRIRKLHVNHLGWIASYDPGNSEVRAGAAIMQKCFGYRFVITDFSYPKCIGDDGALAIDFHVTNIGSSPFYYNWPVEISLIEPDSHDVVWSHTCKDLDIRTWLPGDNWDITTQSYSIPPRSYHVRQNFAVDGVKDGEYILCIAILDPAGNLPCARFAIENYYRGGRHPMGRIGLRCRPASYLVTGFDALQGDNSLHYFHKADISSNDLPFVSRTNLHTKRAESPDMTAYIR